MSHPTDDYWKHLLADEEYWTALLNDDAFWDGLTRLSPENQADALFARYRAARPGDTLDIQRLRVGQMGLLAGVVDMGGLEQTRALWAPSAARKPTR